MVGNTEFSLTDKQRRTILSVGYYHITWSVTEALIEYAISKLLGLGPIEGSIVTAGQMFVGRAKTLEALLTREKGGNKKALKYLRRIMNNPDRVDLTHSIVGLHDDGLYFRRRKVEGGLRSTDIPYDSQSLFKKAVDLSLLASKLEDALGISTEEFQEFFQTAHSAQAKARKSP